MLAAAMLIAFLLSLAPPLPSPSRAQASSLPGPDDAVARLNAWRAGVGLGPVVHDELLSRGCKKHARYFSLNPTHRWHGETASARTPASRIGSPRPTTAWRCSTRGLSRAGSGASSA